MVSNTVNLSRPQPSDRLARELAAARQRQLKLAQAGRFQESAQYALQAQRLRDDLDDEGPDCDEPR